MNVFILYGQWYACLILITETCLHQGPGQFS